MQTKVQIEDKEFDTVKFFRAVKEKIGMTFEQFKQHISNRKLKTVR